MSILRRDGVARRDFREITVTSVRHGKATLSAQPSLFTEKPMPFSQAGNEIGFPMRFDEPFTLDRHIILMVESPKELEKRLGPPTFESTTKMTGTGSYTLNGEEYPVVYWSGSIMNRRGAPSAAIGWKIYLEFPDGKRVDGIPPPFTGDTIRIDMVGFNVKYIRFKKDEFIPRLASIQPVAEGTVVAGWFWGAFPGIDRFSLGKQHAAVVLEYSDVVAGKAHFIRDELGKPFNLYPGLKKEQ
jgi:hypothetical protein